MYGGPLGSGPTRGGGQEMASGDEDREGANQYFYREDEMPSSSDTEIEDPDVPMPYRRKVKPPAAWANLPGNPVRTGRRQMPPRQSSHPHQSTSMGPRDHGGSGLSRNHSLKYTGGALVDQRSSPMSFDHTFEGLDENRPSSDEADRHITQKSPSSANYTGSMVSQPTSTKSGGALEATSMASSLAASDLTNREAEQARSGQMPSGYPGRANGPPGSRRGSSPGIAAQGYMASSPASGSTPSPPSQPSLSSPSLLRRRVGSSLKKPAMDSRLEGPMRPKRLEDRVALMALSDSLRRCASSSMIPDHDGVHNPGGDSNLEGNLPARPGPRKTYLRVPDCGEDDDEDEEVDDQGQRSTALKSKSAMNIAEMAAACAAGAAKVVALGNLSQPMSISQARSRSYLVGSCGAGSISLLGPQELDKQLPEPRRRKVRVFVGTWNMNGQNPPKFLADFLLPRNLAGDLSSSGDGGSKTVDPAVPDLLAIGTQETYQERQEWEARLQDTLGPSHVLYHSASLGTLHLAIFIRRELIWFCSLPDVDSFNTRPGPPQFRTKGAVAIAFILFGTSFLFVNAHLTAHQENARDRVRDIRRLNEAINLPKVLPPTDRQKANLATSPHGPSSGKDFTDNFDVVFWCGDLNFRLEQSRKVVLAHQHADASGEANGGGPGLLLDFDQLNYLRNDGLIFRGYQEDPITFQPTYKYDIGSNEFDSSHKQRVPSYTDRILYKSRRVRGHDYHQVRPLYYDSVQDVTTSDHKPVWGMWEVTIRPGKDSSVPLSGGLFNREIYLEGLRRRSGGCRGYQPSRIMDDRCTIQ